jgi:hypothetical protein
VIVTVSGRPVGRPLLEALRVPVVTVTHPRRRCHLRFWGVIEQWIAGTAFSLPNGAAGSSDAALGLLTLMLGGPVIGVGKVDDQRLALSLGNSQ